MDSWLTALGATGLIFHAAALYVWLSLRQKVDTAVWWAVVVGYFALLTHRVNELLGLSDLFAQLSAVLIAYVALYAVLRAQRHIAINTAFSTLVLKIAEQPRPQLAEQLAERIVELKDQVHSLENAKGMSEVQPFKAQLAHNLAKHFITSREQLNTVSAQLKLYKDVSDASPVPMVITNFAGDLVYANPAYLRLLGGCLRDVLGSGWQRYVSKAGLDAVNDHWFYEVEKESTHINGRITYLIDNAPVECVYNMSRISDGYCGFVIPVNKT